MNLFNLLIENILLTCVNVIIIMNNRFALTGNFGSGKTTALKMFKTLGCIIQNIDEICDNIIYKDSKNELYIQILKYFGNVIINKNKEIDKKKLANIIFNDYSKLKWINQIVQPFLIKKILDIVISHNDNEILVFEIPLLYEAKLHVYFDSVINVYIDTELQYVRLENNGWSKEQIFRRLNFQISNEYKIKLSDYCIINNTNKQNLFMQCKILYKFFLSNISF